jgi:hypothetical protein
MISNNISSFPISGLNQESTNSGALSVTIDFSAPHGSIQIPTDFKSRNFGNIQLHIEFQNIDYIQSSSETVDHKIILDGNDISDLITSSVIVTATEGAARTAVLSFFDDSATIEPYELIDKNISVSYAYGGANVRIFTGKVHEPSFDHDTCIMTITCSDILQETVEPITEQEIEQAIGGLWDENIFRPYKDGWTTAQERMSTLDSSYDLDPYRNPRITKWTPKTTEDFLIDADSTVYKTPKISFAKRRNIINKVNLTFTASFNKKWQKDQDHQWRTGDTFDKWLSKPYGLPTKKLIEDSLNSFTVKYITFTSLPDATGSYDVDGTTFLWSPTAFSRALAFGCSFSVSRRWLQTISNNYTVCIQAPESITRHGELSVQDKKTYSIDNGRDWEDYKQYSVSALAVTDGAGGESDTSDIDYQNAIDTAIAINNARILKSHRQNTVSFSSPLNPTYDLAHTVRVNLGKIDHKGKISKIVFNIDKARGSAIMQVEASFYLPKIAPSTTQQEDPLTIDATPNFPEQTPALGGGGLQGIITGSGLLNRVGDETDLTQPNQDDNWIGWVTNFSGHNRYNERWKVKIDGVDDEYRDKKQVDSAHIINVPIPK